MNRKHTYTGVGTAALGGVVAAFGAMLLAGFSSASASATDSMPQPTSADEPSREAL